MLSDCSRQWCMHYVVCRLMRCGLVFGHSHCTTHASLGCHMVESIHSCAVWLIVFLKMCLQNPWGTLNSTGCFFNFQFFSLVCIQLPVFLNRNKISIFTCWIFNMIMNTPPRQQLKGWRNNICPVVLYTVNWSTGNHPAQAKTPNTAIWVRIKHSCSFDEMYSCCK